MSQMEVNSSRQLSSVRIHVDRVTVVLRQSIYTILEGKIVVKMLITTAIGDSPTDKIVTVCRALCNSCYSVVEFQ